jgi:hypothetical protein
MIAPKDHGKPQAPAATPAGRRRARHRAPGSLSATGAPRATYRDLGAIGLAPAEAANLTAYLSGLRPVHGWTFAEIGRLIFLRFLVEQGRIAR